VLQDCKRNLGSGIQYGIEVNGWHKEKEKIMTGLTYKII
jgi:hypothetical protein